ncbi:hypothetical protein BGZ76_010360 [Entomortierella beljakovae]|nr:hypothetical protein BGZ76_010360 [Entomortierella beljakovae]
MHLNVVRPLGASELMFVAFTKLLKIFNVVVGNKIHFRSLEQTNQGFVDISSWKTSQEWAQLLNGPLTWLLDQNPNLSVVIDDTHSLTPNFLRLDSIDIAKLIRVAPIEKAADINNQQEIENGTLFNLDDKTTPLWRLVISPIKDEPSSFYLLFAFNHIIADGMSAMILTEQIIEQLNIQTKSMSYLPFDFKRSTLVPITTTRPLADPIELRANCKPSILKILKTIRWELLPTRVKRFMEPKYWSGDFDCDEDCTTISQTELLQLTDQETTKVIDAAKQHSTTVNSILYTASLFALKSTFMLNSEEAVQYGTTINLRSLLPNPIPRSDQGIYAGIIDTNYVRVNEETEFWKTTTEYGKQILQEKSEAGVRNHLETAGMSSLIPKKEGAMEKALVDRVRGTQHGRQRSFGITNIGVGWRQDNKDQLEFLIEDALFSASPLVIETAIIMAVATANNRLSFSILWSKSSFDNNGRERMRLFLQSFKRILMKAVESEEDHYFYKDAKNNS